MLGAGTALGHNLSVRSGVNLITDFLAEVRVGSPKLSCADCFAVDHACQERNFLKWPPFDSLKPRRRFRSLGVTSPLHSLIAIYEMSCNHGSSNSGKTGDKIKRGVPASSLEVRHLTYQEVMRMTALESESHEP